MQKRLVVFTNNFQFSIFNSQFIENLCRVARRPPDKELKRVLLCIKCSTGYGWSTRNNHCARECNCGSIGSSAYLIVGK